MSAESKSLTLVLSQDIFEPSPIMLLSRKSWIHCVGFSGPNNWLSAPFKYSPLSKLTVALRGRISFKTLVSYFGDLTAL